MMSSRNSSALACNIHNAMMDVSMSHRIFTTGKRHLQYLDSETMNEAVSVRKMNRKQKQTKIK